jgi:hypothetical protein
MSYKSQFWFTPFLVVKELGPGSPQQGKVLTLDSHAVKADTVLFNGNFHKLVTCVSDFQGI